MNLSINTEKINKTTCFGAQDYTRLKVRLNASETEAQSIQTHKLGSFPLAMIHDTKADHPFLLTTGQVLNQDWHHDFFRLASVAKASDDIVEATKLLKVKMQFEDGGRQSSQNIEI